MRRKSRSVLAVALSAVLLSTAFSTAQAQQNAQALDETPTELTDAMRRFVADRGSVTRFFDIPTTVAMTGLVHRFLPQGGG